jgi:hypothetical protein
LFHRSGQKSHAFIKTCLPPLGALSRNSDELETKHHHNGVPRTNVQHEPPACLSGHCPAPTRLLQRRPRFPKRPSPHTSIRCDCPAVPVDAPRCASPPNHLERRWQLLFRRAPATADLCPPVASPVGASASICASAEERHAAAICAPTAAVRASTAAAVRASKSIPKSLSAPTGPKTQGTSARANSLILGPLDRNQLLWHEAGVEGMHQ